MIDEKSLNEETLILKPVNTKYYWGIVGYSIFFYFACNALILKTIYKPGSLSVIVQCVIAVIFTLCFLIYLISAVLPGRGTLTLTKEGVSCVSFWGKAMFYPWTQISRIYINSLGVSTRLGIQLSSDESHKWRGITAYSYPGMDHYKLVELLNEWKERYTGE